MKEQTLQEAAKLLLIAVKNGDVKIYPNSDKTPDYVQILENALSQQEPVKGVEELKEWFMQSFQASKEWDAYELWNLFEYRLKQFLPHLTPNNQQSEAVEFAQWAASNYTKGKGWGDKWMCDRSSSTVIFTTEQLYAECQKQKGINQSK